MTNAELATLLNILTIRMGQYLGGIGPSVTCGRATAHWNSAKDEWVAGHG